MPNMSPKKAPMPSQDPNVRNKNFLEVQQATRKKLQLRRHSVALTVNTDLA